MATFPLSPSHVNRLCEGTQFAKHGWTEERRAEVVVDGETCHEDSSQARPFELWESVAIQQFRRRYYLGATS